MRVLVICPTYGRLPFLGRMVASFLSQTHTDSELVIINDDPDVHVSFNHERVTIVNINKKHLLDVKRNIGAIMGRNYDLLIPLDDDDIILPKQIEYHVGMFEQNPEMGAFRNKSCFIVYGGAFKYGINAPNCVAYRPETYLECGAYNHFAKNSGGDAKFYSKLPNKVEVCDKENTYFIYNFSGVNYHLSCIDEKKLEHIVSEQKKILNISSNFVIEPDYKTFQDFLDITELYKKDETPIQVRGSRTGHITYGDDVEP